MFSNEAMKRWMWDEADDWSAFAVVPHEQDPQQLVLKSIDQAFLESYFSSLDLTYSFAQPSGKTYFALTNTACFITDK